MGLFMLYLVYLVARAGLEYNQVHSLVYIFEWHLTSL